MSRTMTQEEYIKFKKFVEKKRSELTTKEASIDFLYSVGFCDKKGAVLSPYKTSRKKK